MTAAQIAPAVDATPDTVVSGRSTGLSLGHVFVPGEDVSLMLIGYQTVILKERATTTEFALYASPEALAEGALGLVPKISIVSAVRQGETWITLKFGANLPMLIERGSGGGGIFGLHAGLGAILPASARTVLRLEIEPHFYPQIPIFPIMLFSIGIASRPFGKS
jgi:hypothetical protein